MYILHAKTFAKRLSSLIFVLIISFFLGVVLLSCDEILNLKITGTLTYDPITTSTDSSSWTSSPKWTSITNSAQKISYSINPIEKGITIDSLGQVRVGTTATAKSLTEYTVVATAISPYSGSITSTIQITVTVIPTSDNDDDDDDDDDDEITIPNTTPIDISSDVPLSIEADATAKTITVSWSNSKVQQAIDTLDSGATPTQYKILVFSVLDSKELPIRSIPIETTTESYTIEALKDGSYTPVLYITASNAKLYVTLDKTTPYIIGSGTGTGTGGDSQDISSTVPLSITLLENENKLVITWDNTKVISALNGASISSYIISVFDIENIALPAAIQIQSDATPYTTPVLQPGSYKAYMSISANDGGTQYLTYSGEITIPPSSDTTPKDISSTVPLSVSQAGNRRQLEVAWNSTDVTSALDTGASIVSYVIEILDINNHDTIVGSETLPANTTSPYTTPPLPLGSYKATMVISADDGSSYLTDSNEITLSSTTPKDISSTVPLSVSLSRGELLVVAWDSAKVDAALDTGVWIVSYVIEVLDINHDTIVHSNTLQTNATSPHTTTSFPPGTYKVTMRITDSDMTSYSTYSTDNITVHAPIDISSDVTLHTQVNATEKTITVSWSNVDIQQAINGETLVDFYQVRLFTSHALNDPHITPYRIAKVSLTDESYTTSISTTSSPLPVGSYFVELLMLTDNSKFYNIVNPTLLPIDALPPFITLSSASFNDGSAIPVSHTNVRYRQGSENTTPELSWRRADDSSTGSFAILMYDEDAPDWHHWLVTDIPIDITTLPETRNGEFNPTIGKIIQGGGNSGGYYGPTPPSGIHTYHFIVFAIKESQIIFDNVDAARTLQSTPQSNLGNALMSFLNTPQSSDFTYNSITYHVLGWHEITGTVNARPSDTTPKDISSTAPLSVSQGGNGAQQLKVEWNSAEVNAALNTGASIASYVIEVLDINDHNTIIHSETLQAGATSPQYTPALQPGSYKATMVITADDRSSYKTTSDEITFHPSPTTPTSISSTAPLSITLLENENKLVITWDKTQINTALNGASIVSYVINGLNMNNDTPAFTPQDLQTDVTSYTTPTLQPSRYIIRLVITADDGSSYLTDSNLITISKDISSTVPLTISLSKGEQLVVAWDSTMVNTELDTGASIASYVIEVLDINNHDTIVHSTTLQAGATSPYTTPPLPPGSYKATMLISARERPSLTSYSTYSDEITINAPIDISSTVTLLTRVNAIEKTITVSWSNTDIQQAINGETLVENYQVRLFTSNALNDPSIPPHRIAHVSLADESYTTSTSTTSSPLPVGSYFVELLMLTDNSKFYNTVNPTLLPIDGLPPFITLSSTSFNDGSAIPVSHMYTGYKTGSTNTTPELSWMSADTSNTGSFVILMYDEDSPNWHHWLVTDIPIGTTTLPETRNGEFNPPIGKIIQGGRNLGGYYGPTPPSGIHTYHFIVFAIQESEIIFDNIDTARTFQSTSQSHLGSALMSFLNTPQSSDFTYNSTTYHVLGWHEITGTVDASK